EIRTVEDALARPDLFPNPSDGSKGAVHNCPEGWNCRISTENLFKAFDGENKSFSLINSESGAELDASIAQAFETNTGWLGYYWAPTATLGKYDMVRLSFGVPHDQDEWNACTSQRDCEDPQPNAWPRSEVYTVMTDEIFRRGGEVPRYLSKRSWSNATVNMMLAWMVENRASIDEGARHFLENYGDVWEDWVTPAAAIKVRNHLANS
ncbi:MAG: glycine betaine ABC transporter substrate-binding protein, partial [Pseudomonadota bacterium]